MAERSLIGRVVYAEAAGEPRAGQVAVARVILNRARKSSVLKVIFQKNAFESVTKQSRLWRSGRSIDVLDEALASKDDFTAFRTVTCKGGERYFSKLRKVATIGSHNFYR